MTNLGSAVGVIETPGACGAGGPAGGVAWRPLLSGQLADEALRAADGLLAGVDRACPGSTAPWSLSSGAAGLAVCYAQFAQARADEAAAAAAAACLGGALDAVASERMTAELYSGFTGIAWAGELVEALIGRGESCGNEKIDAALTWILAQPLGEQTPYGLVRGLAGLGVYSLARWPRGLAAECLERLVRQFADRARRGHDGACWWTPPSLLLGPLQERFPTGGVDVGVAHGMAGVLPLLARACRLGIGDGVAGRLLAEAVRWLLAHLIQDGSSRTAPSFLTDRGNAAPARSAWCYGDPGLALALLLAAREVGDEEWEQAAVELALTAAARPARETGVTDAGLCHGTAGLAHLFNRMQQMTGRPELGHAARRWIERTLWLCEQADWRAGADRPAGADWRAGAAGPAWNGDGLLEGAAGVALALLAASTPAEPAWDQMLLVATGGPAGLRAR